VFGWKACLKKSGVALPMDTLDSPIMQRQESELSFSLEVVKEMGGGHDGEL